MNAEISVIIVSYNTRDLLKECMETYIAGTPGIASEIIVVDNASSDGSPRMVRDVFPFVRLIESRTNLGFSKATNLGLQVATSPFVLLLNSDALVEAGCVPRMRDFMKHSPTAAVLGPKLFNADGSVQEVARGFPRPANALFGRRTLLTRLFPNAHFVKQYLVMRDRDQGEPFEVDWVSGACMMIRQEVMASVGRLDERFFMYWEDADFCKRVKDAGYRVYCLPSAHAVHDEGSSSVPSNLRLIYEFNKSVYHYYRKHHTHSSLHPLSLLAFLFLTARTLLLVGYRGIRNLASAGKTGKGNRPSGPGTGSCGANEHTQECP